MHKRRRSPWPPIQSMGYDPKNVVLLTDATATRTDLEKHLGKVPYPIQLFMWGTHGGADRFRRHCLRNPGGRMTQMEEPHLFQVPVGEPSALGRA